MFKLMVLGVCLYLILGEMILQADSPTGEYKCEKFSAEWFRIRQDGTRTPIGIPGKCDAKRDEIVTLEAVLPSNIDNNTCLCFRSSRQDMKIYVDGVLRQQYSTDDTRLFGKTSAVAYVFLELNPEDAGKIITLETQTDSSYSGIFYAVYYGDKMGIWRYFFQQSGTELIIALFMLIIGIGSILGSIVFQLCYHKKIELEYLGWGVFLVAVWLIANSVFRQLLFPSISVISDMTFYMIMLMAIPFLLYMNGIQNERYHRLYILAGTINIIDFFICTILHVMNKKDFADTIIYMAVVCFLSIFMMGITIIIDIWNGYIREYRLVAIGILGASLAAIAQIIIYFQRTIPFNGVIIALGLIFLLLVSIVDTLRDILHMEKEKQQAILSNESKGRFLANMSHEIRTPINAVLGMDAMILRECKDMKIKEYALDIQIAGQSLLSLINDILDFSKIESGKMEIIPVEYDFSSVIHDISNMILTKAKDKNLIMNVFVEQTLPYRLFGDEIRIRQVLINLLTNAVKYTNEGSVSLIVKGKIQGDSVLLNFSVEDTGIGIKEEDISKLFVEFERIEEKRNRNIEGTGLGMNITTRLLEMMGSRLNVESVYGEGSKFSFELEQQIIDAEPIGNLEERIRQQTLEYNYDVTFTAPEAHVLVVDDNTINRKVFINLLKETKIKIDEAANGKECLEMVFEKHYDLIFLDHMMPEMDGIETIHCMKRKQEYPCKDTPVIVLTANAISGAKEMYLSEGFDDFLSKPIIPEKLEKMLQHMLPQKLLYYETARKEEEKGIQDQIPQDIMDLPQIDGVDWSYGWLHLPDMKLLMDTVFEFYSSIDFEADYLEDCYNKLAYDKAALDLYRIKVHAMKNSAALIGVISLSGMAKVLESAARDGKQAVIKSMTPMFLEEWRSYKEKLEKCVIQKEEEKIPVEDYSIILTILEMLRNAMEDMDIDVADETMKQLKKYQYPSHMQIYIEQLSVAVANLDSEQVAVFVQRIVNQINESEVANEENIINRKI